MLSINYKNSTQCLTSYIFKASYGCLCFGLNALKKNSFSYQISEF